jgi:hypothetical protein
MLQIYKTIYIALGCHVQYMGYNLLYLCDAYLKC